MPDTTRSLRNSQHGCPCVGGASPPRETSCAPYRCRRNSGHRRQGTTASGWSFEPVRSARPYVTHARSSEGGIVFGGCHSEFFDHLLYKIFRLNGIRAPHPDCVWIRGDSARRFRRSCEGAAFTTTSGVKKAPASYDGGALQITCRRYTQRQAPARHRRAAGRRDPDRSSLRSNARSPHHRPSEARPPHHR